MSKRRTSAVSLMLAAVVVGCGGDDPAPSADGQKTLTVYTSVPLQGAGNEPARAMVNATRLALKQRNGRVGSFRVRHVSLDDSTAQAGTWDPSAVSDNAGRAIRDDTTIGYIGEFNSGATALSLPVLNEVGIPQLSVNTAVGLFSSGPGAESGEPEKYYPSGKRTFISPVPPNSVEAEAIVGILQEDGCGATALINDKEVYGAGMAESVVESAKRARVRLLGNQGIDVKAPNYRSAASALRSQGADCIVWAGCTSGNAVQLFKDLSAAMPAARLYATDCTADSGFTDPAEGGIPAAVAEKVTVFVATLPQEEYPPDGRRFFQDYEREFGDADPDPYAIYTYEAVQLLFDAIEKAGPRGADRAVVLRNLFATRGREGVLGAYDVKPNGNTTLGTYGVWTIRDGALRFRERVEAG